MRKTFLFALLVVCFSAFAQQTEVTYSDDFQSYGSPKNPPGWVDTAIGASKPEAAGLFKTWPDPTQGNKATNVVFGSKSSSGNPGGNNPRIGHFSTLTTKTFSANGRFEYRGRFIRTNSDSRIGFTFLSSYPEKDQYYLIGLWSVPNSTNLTMQLHAFGAGTFTGTTNSAFTPAANTWYRFLIQVDDVASTTKIRARFWADGSTEPSTFSIDATDAATTRLTTGRIGIWAAVKGSNYVDDLFAKSPVDHTAPVIKFFEGGVELPPDTTTAIDHDARVDVRATDDLSGVASITATADGQPYTPLTPIAIEGPHVVAARAVDNVGNASTSQTTVLVDKTPPVITLTADGAPLPLPVSRFKTVPSIVIAATDQWTGATFSATLDGQPYASNTPISVQGTHHLVVEAIDGVKNKSIVQATILVDLGAPVIEFYEKGVKLASPAKFKFDPAIEIRLTDEHSTPTYTATLENGAAWKSLDPMPLGWHKITVNAVDEAGNTSSATLDVLVDKDAPVVVLRESGNVLDPAATAKYNRDVAIDVSITDATSAIATSSTSLNGQPYVSGTLITVEQNTHTITVHAEDEAGNVTDVTLAVLVDKSVPVIAFSESGVKLDERELQKFRRDASIVIDVTDVISTATYTATITTPARGTSAPFTSGTPVTVEDTHAILVQAVDDAGNTAEATLTILVDKTPPSIAFSESGTPLDTTQETPFGRDVAVDISVTDNLPGVSYTAKLDGADYTSGTPITSDGSHVVAVHAVDAAENTRDGEVKVLVDKTGPTIAFLESNVELDATKRNDFNRLPSIVIRVADALSTVTNVAKLDGADYTSGAPVPEGYHTITVRATDARGNVTDAKLDLLVDVTPPVVKLKDKQTGNDLPASGAIFARDVDVDADTQDISETTTVATLDGNPFSLSVPVSQEGTRTVEVTVTDELQWKTTVASTFVVDKTAPVLTPVVTVAEGTTPLLNGASFARDIVINVNAVDITPVQITATIDGQPYTLGQTYTTDGTHVLVVNAVDAAGNRSETITLTFHIDKNAPEVTLEPFPEGECFTADVVFTITVKAATETTTVATIDDAAYTLGSPYAPEGHHHIKIVVTNIAGLKTTLEADFTIDKTAPTLTLYAKENTPFTDGMKFAADLTPTTVADDNLTRPPKVVVLLDGAELPAGTVVSEEKFHTISATATDDCGLTTSVGPFGFVLDKTAPEVTVTVDGEKLVDGAKFNKAITPLIEADDLTEPVYTITLDGASYTRGTVIESDDNHTLVVKVKDDLGNETVLDPIHFTIDKTPPVVLILDKLTNEPFTGGKFKRPVTPLVRITDLTDTLTNATLLDRTTNQESPWTSGQEISSDGHYTLKVTVTDELGWVTVAPPIEFTIDQAAPVITVTEGGAPLVTNTIFNRDAQPKITVTDTTTPTIDAKLNDQPFVSETLVTEERKHTLVVKATDELGFATELLPIVFTVDKTPPVVTVTENGVVFADGALLDHDAVPQVVASDLTPYTIAAKVDGQMFNVGGSVTAEGPHTFDVTVTDSAGWQTTVPTIQFVVDKSAPVVTITEGQNGPPLESGDEFKVTIAPWVNVTDITATTIAAKLNGVAWTPNTPVADEGPYVLEVIVTDAVGRATVVPPIAFIIDKSVPVVQVLESSTPFVSGTKLNRPAQLAIAITDLTKTTTVATVGETAFTFPGTISNDGKHTLSVTVTDNLGQATVVPPIAFTIDQTRPVVTITESGQPLVSGAAFNRNVKPEITIDDLTQTTTLATLNGAPFTFGTEITEEGQYTLAVEVTDELGWRTVVPAIVFFVDRTPPVVTLKEGESDLTDGLWFNRDVSPRAIITDTTATTTTATLARNDGAAEAYVMQTPITEEGKYTLAVTVTDAVGLKTDVPPVSFTIDKTPPAITILYPAAESTVTTAQLVVVGDSDDAVSVTVNDIETTIDPAEKKYATTTALELLEGENALVAFGIDRAGNNTTITQIVRVDTRAPELTITAPAPNACFNTRSVQVTGTVSDPNVASVKVTIAQSTAAPVDATLSEDRRSWTATLQFASEGKFVISVSARDNQNHESIANVPVTIDETKPRIEITNAGAPIPQFINRTVAPFVRVLDADLKATLTVTLDGAAYVSGTPIVAEKEYELKATATDCAGNQSDEAIVRFVIDKTAPQFLTLSPANGASIGTTSQVSGTVSPDTVSVVVDGTGAAASVANGAFAFASLPIADGLNRFTFIATDRAGNATRIDYSFSLKTSAPSVEIVENGSPIVSGTRYTRPVTIDIRSNESDATLTATHNGQPFTSGTTISENGSHTISATARDTFGHTSTSEVTFTIDRTGPVVTITEPQDGASVSTERVRVRGTITGDPVSAAINGADLPLSNGAFDVEIALEPGPNQIIVIALDAAGNAGQASVDVTRGGGSLGLILTSPVNNLLTNRRTTIVAGQVLTPAGVTHVTVNGTEIPIDAAGAFRKSDFTLNEGQNVITASVNKGAAQGSVTVTVTADFTPPVVTVRESGNPLEDEARFATQAVLTVEATDAGQSMTPTILIDAVSATSPTTITASGGHTIIATARDAAGNEKRVERTFFIGAGGTGACALSDFDPANGAIVTSNTVTLVGRTGGAAGVKVNGTAAIVANGSFSATVNLPVEGANNVTINCTDATGADTGTPSTITLTRVTGAPSITITTPTNNSVTGDETITVTGTTDASEVVVNGSAATVTGTTFTATNVRLAAGVNVIVARAKNSAGRASTDSVRVTFLKNLPTITITSPAGAFTTTNTSIDVSGVWTNLDASSLTVTNGGAAATAQTTTNSDTTGTFKAPSITLLLGAQTITIRGVDRLGRAATATVAITRVEGTPSIAITEPADNTYFPATAPATLTVSGTFTAQTGATIEVNGVAATMDTSTFTAEVPFSTLPGGLTPIVARVSEPAGTSDLDTVRVTKLAPAPTVEQVFPEADATNVSAGALPLVLFSAPMDRASVRDAFRLENAAGTPVNGEVTLDRDVLTFAPAVLLDAGERYTIRVATTAKDLGGNALAQSFASSFTVAVTAPATAPSLNAHAPRACEAIDLSGTAPAGARLRIDLGTLSFNTTASSTGAFTFHLPLSGRGGFQVARVRIVGTDGSLSPAAEASFEVDCAGPQVSDASFDRTANVLTITFSKPIDLTTITTGADGSVRLQLLDGAIVGGTASLSTPSIVAITPSQNLGTSSFTLTVTTAVKDTNGVALSSPYSRAFAIGGDFEPGPGAGYIAGEIFDAATGRPLPGATVTIDVPVAAFARGVRSDEVTTMSAVAAIADNRGRYLRALPEGAHTIRASADGYTTVWRQIIVRAGAGVIPTDIRLTPRGATQNGSGAALVLTDGGVGDRPLSRAAELRIPGGVVASGNHVTLTSLGAQSLPGLLPLGWSPLASAEIVSNATSLPGSELTFAVPKSDLDATAQTLTAVRYHEDRDEWRVISAVVAVSSDGKSAISVDAPGAYALVYPDKAPHLQAPPVPTAGGVLTGVADRCATETCPPLVAKNALELVPPVVLPTQRTVATLRIEGAGTSVFPSGTAVQAYVDEELHLADGTRDVVSPFVTDLLLYRSLSGDTGEAQFHLAPSGRAAEVVLEVGYDHIRILPYPERLDRGALIGPEGGRVPADDRVAVEIPAGATTDALKATVASIQDFSGFGTIAGYRIVGGLSLSMQWASQTAGEEVTPVELLKPARATFTVSDATLPSQLILVEVVEGTAYGRIFRLAAQITALEGGVRFSTKTIDRAVLPVDGIVREGTYLLLAPNAPIAFATGTVHLGVSGPAAIGARVLTPPLGVIDLTRVTGIFNVPVPATTFTLVPRTLATGDGAAYNHPTAAATDQIVNVGALSIVSQPPTVTMTVFSHRDTGLTEVPADGATGVTPTSSVKATFTPGLDPLSVAADSITVFDDQSGAVVPGRATAQGATGILWTIQAGTRLRVDATFVAVVSPSVRGANGTPLGTAVTAKFSTVSALSSPDVDPSKIRITIPDANGHSSIIGAPGALKEHWNAVAVRRGRDFSNRPQDDADAERKFRIELGTTGKAEDRVTIEDLIDLQIINDAGAVAAIIPLGLFTSEDGRGFVARPGKETRYTTVDNISLTVPAEAFDKATVITIRPAERSAVVGVPGFDEELQFHAGFQVDFEGIAKKRLDIQFPTPASLPEGQSSFLGYYGNSVRGPRIMVIDLLRRDGGTLTTHHPPDGSVNLRMMSNGVATNAIVNPSVLRDMLGGFDRASIIIGFTFQTSISWITFAPPPVPADFFIPPIKSIYFASFAAERDRILVPVAAGGAFNIVGVDPGSGLEIFDAPFSEIGPGEPTSPTGVTLPTTNERGPHPVFASPGRVEILDLNADELTDGSIRNIIANFDGSTVTLSNATDALPAKTRVEVMNLRNASVAASDDFASGGLSFSATKGDRLVFLISDHDVDPNANITVVFNEPIHIGTEDEMREQFKLLVRDPSVSSSTFQPVPGLLDIKDSSGGRRISVVHRGSLQRGKIYRLLISNEIHDEDPTLQLRLGQLPVGSPPSGGPVPPDMHVDFGVRAPKGLVDSFDISAGTVRDLAMIGNILFVSAMEGGIFAYDASNPMAMGSNPPFARIEPVVGNGQHWGLATDVHGRLYATGVTPMYGIVRSYRAEDFDCGLTLSCIDPLPNNTVQRGNAILSWRTGINVGVPLAAMMTGAWPEAIPRKIKVVTRDEEEVDTFENLVSGASDAGNGFLSGTLEVTASGAYDKQRVTVINTTRDYRWSAEIPAGGTTTMAVIGHPTDELRIMRNLSTVGVVSLFGYGLGVYDLNAVDANSRNLGAPGWERLETTYVLSDGLANGAGDCDRYAQAQIGRSCEIGNLEFSPETALTIEGDTVSILALETNKGLVHLTMAPSATPGQAASFGRPGSIVFQERFGGGTSFGHPRINKLRNLYKAASGRNPVPRYASVGTFRRNGSTYALVSAFEYGLMVVKLGATMSAASLVDVVWIPAGAQSVRVSDRQDLAVVVDGKGRVLLINLGGLDESALMTGPVPPCTNINCEWDLFPTATAAITGAPGGPGEVGADDPRIVWKSVHPLPPDPDGIVRPLVYGTIPPFFDSETGFLYAGSVLNTKMRVVSAVDPTVRFVGDTGITPGRVQRLNRVVPLGVDPPAGATAGNGSVAAFRIEARLPGGMPASNMNFAIDSETVLGAPSAQTPEPFPPSRLRMSGPRPTSNFVLRHDAPTSGAANLRFQRGYNRMVTPWVLAIADPRATNDYSPSGTVPASADCDSCDRPAHLATSALNTEYFELWSAGRVIAAHPDTGAFAGSPYAFFTENHRLDARINSVIADLVRPSDGTTDVDKLAGKNLPTAGVMNEQVVAVNTGEVVLSSTDLMIDGRGIDFDLTRHYSSAIAHIGPLGRNFDSPLFARVQQLPNGDVAFYDGTGRRDVFTSGVTPPEGVFVSMRRGVDGNVIVAYPGNTLLYFDNVGRLARITDRNTTKADGSDGNAMLFGYGANGKLASVVDPTGRVITLEYYNSTGGGGYDGCVWKVKDFDGRTVEYTYDASARLLKASGPDPVSPGSASPSTTYEWGSAATTAAKSPLYDSGQIRIERDGLARTVWTVGYNANYPWAAQTVTSGGGTWAVSLNSGDTSVTDPLGHTTSYARNADATIASIVEPGGAATTYTYDQGRLGSVTRPLGDETRFGYATAGDPLSMPNVQTITQVPRAGSPERTAGMTRVTHVTYGTANLPTSITGPDGATTSIVRDARGNPQTVTDPTGVTTTYTFDERGLMQTSSAPGTGTVAFTYVPGGVKQGYIQTMTTSDGAWTYGSDNRGNIVSVAGPGTSISYTVNKLDQVEKEVNGVSSVSLKYDAARNLTDRDVLAGAIGSTPIFSNTKMTTDEVGRVTIRNENGIVTQYGYDAAWNLKSVIRPAAAPVTYGYDERGRRVSTTEGSRTTTYGYDSNNVPTSETSPLGKTRTINVNGFNEVAGGTDPLGVTRVSSRDAAGRPVDTRVVKPSSSGDVLLAWSTREYDRIGRVTRKVEKLFSSPLALPAVGDPTGAIDVVTATEYDDVARKVTTTDPRGVKTITELDLSGRVARITDGAGNVVEMTYDGNGSKTMEKRLDHSPDGTVDTYTTSFEYDDQGRLVMSARTSNQKSLVTRYQYDERGNRLSKVSPDGRETRYEYDLRGNRTKEIDAEGGITEYMHDDAGRVLTVKDPNGNLTTFGYDAFGNLLFEKRSDGATWSFTYDDDDRRKTMTDPNGTVTTYVYDDAGRLTEMNIAPAANVLGPSTVSYVHDDLGNVVSTETSQGVKTRSTYDSLGRMLTEGLQIGDGDVWTISRDFDVSGNVIGIGYPSGLTITQTIDPLGRIASITTGGTVAPLVTYGYAGSHLVSRTLFNGIVSTRSHDSFGRLTRIDETVGGAAVRNVLYDRTLAGLKTSIVRADLQKQWMYRYDANGSIVQEMIERIAPAPNPNAMLLSTSYDLDPAFNFRSVARTSQDGAGTTTLTTNTTINDRNQYVAFGGDALEYDANGNLKRVRSMVMRYDADNHLTEAALGDGTSIEILYDANGRKVQETRTMSGGTTVRQYIADGGALLEEYVNGVLAHRYVRGRDEDEIVRAEIGSTAVFPLQDELGNVERLTDASGATLERYEYEGFGKFRIFDAESVLRPESAFGWRWLFQGREYDAALDAYDFRARTLWPNLGRFGQEDMLLSETPESTNLYQSFRLSFVNRTDPSGRWTLDPNVKSYPALKTAMKKARELYKAFPKLATMYKGLNKQFNAKFLEDKTPPTLHAVGAENDFNMNNPTWDLVNINSYLLKNGDRQRGAGAALAIGLLHEQAHAEGKLGGVPGDTGSGFKAFDRYRISDEQHFGWLSDEIIFDGALFLFDPRSPATEIARIEEKDPARRLMHLQTFMAARPRGKSVQKQIEIVKRGYKRFQELFGPVSDPAGIVFDFKKQKSIRINPVTGSYFDPIEEMMDAIE